MEEKRKYMKHDSKTAHLVGLSKVVGKRQKLLLVFLHAAGPFG